MPEVTMNIPDGLFTTITRFVREDSVPGLTNAALEEWAGWLDGSWRPMSISEIEAERIFNIYANVLIETTPSSDHIGEFFDLPLGRARYVMQVLNYRHGAFIRKRQITHIVRALQSGERSTDGETYTIRVDRSVKKILDQTISGLVAEERLRSAVSGRVTLDDVRYEMGQRHHEILLEVFREELEALTDMED